MFKIKVKTMNEIKVQPTTVGTELMKVYKGKPDLGRPAEERALSIVVDFLTLVDNAWLGDKGDRLDTGYAIDLVIETDGNAIGLQIKKSEAGAEKHLAMEPHYVHKKFGGFPDVIVAGPHRTGWNVLMQLTELTELPINKRAKEAINLANAFAGTVQMKKVARRPKDLINLGLAKEHPQGLFFFKNPPPIPTE